MPRSGSFISIDARRVLSFLASSLPCPASTCAFPSRSLLYPRSFHSANPGNTLPSFPQVPKPPDRQPLFRHVRVIFSSATYPSPAAQVPARGIFHVFNCENKRTLNIRLRLGLNLNFGPFYPSPTAYRPNSTPPRVQTPICTSPEVPRAHGEGEDASTFDYTPRVLNYGITLP